MRKSSILVINVNIKLQKRVIQRLILNQSMRKSSIIVMNMNITSKSKATLHYGDQHNLWQSLHSVVRCPHVQVEIVQAGRLELTKFTVEGLQSVVNITDMFLGLFLLIDRFITLPAFLPLSHIMWLCLMCLLKECFVFFLAPRHLKCSLCWCSW